MSELADDAVKIAAKATGLRPDQIERAVTEYRDAISSLEDEPTWTALSHLSGEDFGIHQYIAPDSDVGLQVDFWKSRGDEWASKRTYTYRQKGYETYAEARAIELQERSRPKPYATP